MQARSSHVRLTLPRAVLILLASGVAGIFASTRADDATPAPADTPAATAAYPSDDSDTAPLPADDQSATIAAAPAPSHTAASASSVPIIHPAGPIRYDQAIRDSIGTISVRPAPDAPGATPEFIKQAEYFRSVHDNVEAADYLKLIVTRGDVTPALRARAILELADCLEAQHLDGPALCWLKIWMQLYPTRPEMGAVAYRVATIYKKMGLSDMARDAYYLSLAHSINEGQVNNAEDLKEYTKLTTGTLWAMAANEYDSGRWDRAADLFERYRKEAPSASPISLEDSAFFQADCYYQLHQADKAKALYEATLQAHPFNPLAPQARLRLYHLDVMAHQTEKAGAELEALIWTVRTVWPKDEHYWQQQTAQVLLAINKNNADVLPPLVAGSVQMHAQGKPWQQTLNHYDTLVSYQAATRETMDSSVPTSNTGKAQVAGLSEEGELRTINHELDDLLPPASSDSSQ